MWWSSARVMSSLLLTRSRNVLAARV
jgi:hypothetical protein